MPTTTSGRKVNTMGYYSRNLNGTWPDRPTSVSTWEYDEQSLTWPISVKRAYPADEFRSGTARTVSSKKRLDSGWDWEATTSPRRRYANASVGSNFPITDQVVPIPGVDTVALYNKIRSDVRGEATNLAQMLAEYRQTARLFMDLAKVFVTKGKSLLRKSTYQRGSNPNRRGRAVDPSKTLGSAYLQWTYGVSPLMGDMHSIMTELTERMSLPVYLEGVETRTVRGTSKGTKPINSTISQLTADWEGLRILRHRCQWRAYIDQNMIRNCLVSHGFGNPLAIAWELVPFSFVVDWWINVGEVLSSLDNMILIDKLYVLESTSDKTLLMLQTNPHKLVLKQGTFRYLKRTDTRKAPVTISKVSSFRYKPSVSLKHITNGLALLTQFRR